MWAYIKFLSNKNVFFCCGSVFFLLVNPDFKNSVRMRLSSSQHKKNGNCFRTRFQSQFYVKILANQILLKTHGFAMHHHKH